MANEIGIVWTSEQSALIRDMQKRQLMLEQENVKLKQLAETGKATSKGLGASYSDATKEMSRLSSMAESGFKKSLGPMEAHAQRMKELRVLYRMGKIDMEQFNAAAQKSHKQYYADSGLTEKLRQKKEALKASLAEKEKAEQESARKIAADEKVSEAERLKTLEQANRNRMNAIVSQMQAELSEGEKQHAKQIADEAKFQERKEAKRREAAKKSLDQQRHDFEEGKRLNQAVMSAQEQHNARLERYRELLKMGAIDQMTFNRAVQQSTDAMNGTAGAANSLVSQLKSFTVAGAAIGAVTLVIRQLKAELENLKESQRNAGNAQKTYAQAQREALLNAGPGLTPQDLDAQVSGIASQTGATPTRIMNAVSTSLSFKGGASEKDAIEAVRIAAQQNPDSPEAVTENTKALLLLKQKNPNASMESIAGFLIEAKRASPTVTDADFSSTIAPGIANSSAFDASPRVSAALHAAVGSAIGDADGRVTANAVVSFQMQLKKWLPQFKTFEERLHALQSDPKYKGIKNKLLGSMRDEAKGFEKSKLHAEAKALAPLIDLIKGGNATSELLEKDIRELPEIDQAAGTFTQTMETINSSPVQQNAALHRNLESATEQVQIGDIEGGATGIAREGFEKFLKANGNSALATKVMGMTFDARSWWGGKKHGNNAKIPIQTLMKQLRDLAWGLRNPIGGDESGPAIATDEDIRQAEQVEHLLTMLENNVHHPAAKKPMGPQAGMAQQIMAEVNNAPHNAQNANGAISKDATAQLIQALKENTEATLQASANAVKVEVEVNGQPASAATEPSDPVRGAGLGPVGTGAANMGRY